MATGSGYHRSLERQLRRLRLRPGQPPDAQQWAAVLDLVSTSYEQADADRYLLERAIEISSGEMRALHDVLRRQALHDTLTGLPNRSALVELLGDALARSRRRGCRLGVLFVDLDGFKMVNDSLGHAAGDALLIRAAERIRAVVRPGDVVGRLGGDEFVVVCPDLGGLEEATGIAERIVEEIRQPFHVGVQDTMVTASVGIVVSGDDPPAPEDLLRHADMAMYQAKTRGRSRHAVFDDGMLAHAEGRLATESALRRGIQRGELTLHYQPVISLSDGTTTGMEALVRWRRPGHGLVAPGEFIPIAEQSHLITELDCWVVREACAQAASWPDERSTVAVNLSARDLLGDELMDATSGALRRTGLAPSRLVLEVTETTLMSDSPTITENVARLDRLGVQIAIDDFGTGYSSLSYLGRLPARLLKIDRSFVSTVDEGGASAAIVKALIDMAHALRLTTIAEGVERQSQAAALRALGCDAAQGFLYARPAPLADRAGTGASVTAA